MVIKYRIYNKIQGSISYKGKTIKEYIIVDELDAQLIDLIARKYVKSEKFVVDEIKEVFYEEHKKKKKKDKDKKILDED